MRPRLAVERAAAAEISWEEIPDFEYDGMRGYRCTFPHCDSMILHVPGECEYCAQATWLQEERVRLDVSNTGHTNRAWPCPADRRRSADDYDAWGGNKRKAP